MTARVNGVHENGAKHAPMSALDLAVASHNAQLALLADARGQLEGASRARASAEAAAHEAEQALAAALEQSAANRADDALADAASRARVRLEHARDDLERARAQHDRVVAGASESEGHLAAAERGLELVAAAQSLEDGLRDPLVNEVVADAVRAVVAIRDAVLHVQELMAADVRLADRVRALGGSVRTPDGTAFAAALARALLDVGGALGPGVNENSLRWVFETSNREPDPSGAGRSIRLASMVFDALAVGDRPDVQTHRARLERIAEAWAGEANRADADRELAAVDQARADAEAARVRSEHEGRLLALRRRGPVVQIVPSPPPAAAPRPRPARPGAPRVLASLSEPRGEGEWAVGAVIDGIPTVG